MPSPSTPLIDFGHLPDEAYVDVQTLARLFGTTPSTVWRWTQAGRLPRPVKLGPQTTRWQVAAIRAALSTLTV